MLKGLEKFNLPEVEEKVLKFWKENQIFERTLKKNEKKKKFVFFEGPPTANGRPGIHHILARSFKDIILRYKTMSGFFVPRRGGWDTHGLPVEIEVEKGLGLKSKKEIEQYGIAEFNKKCKESVWKYKDEWEKLTERMGFWLDLKNPYITYETPYIETLWWIIKHAFEKKLLFRGHKVVPWCTRCGTGVSSHEVSLGYKKVEDNTVYVKFKLEPGQKIGSFKTDDKTYVLAWTTTPWTLPGNLALAIGGKIDYMVVEAGHDKFVVADARGKILEGNWKKILGVKGNNLVGLKYEPLFKIKALESKNSYKIYPADFVTTNDGTGVVHTAVMYGEDDYNLGKKVGLPEYHTVDELGKFTHDVPELQGLYVKSDEADKKIIGHLEKHNFLFRQERQEHEYPFCWRCGTRLLYYARNSWFMGMSKLRKKLWSSNKKVNWTPSYIKEGRFGDWIKEAKDWAFSRERYWGTPLPIWKCEKCDKYEAIDRREELSRRLGKSANKYILMRHGESESLTKNVINNNPKELDKYPLTLKGRVQVEESARKINKEKVDLIFSSDFIRTRETAEIVAKASNVKVVFDHRLRELNTGIFDGGPGEKYHDFFDSTLEKFSKTPPEGESLRDVAKRAFDFVSEIERKYKNKTILIVSHESTTWMLETTMSGWSYSESAAEKKFHSEAFIEPAEFIKTEFLHLPRNEDGFVDLHRPYIDEIVFPCRSCKGNMKRIKELADVWFDSGAMPFAQNHYPINKKIEFPADYISEAVDQTRGWFYTLLAVATLMGKGNPYKNVICLGHVLDKNGQKMSKSKGNVVDPWAMIEKYGVDAVRWHFYTVNGPGEPKKFDETDLGKSLRQFISLVYNSYVFYETYALKGKIPAPKKQNVLDKWVFARLNETIEKSKKHLDKYEVGESARKIEEFAGDLSRWYIRRSRRRLQKPESKSDYESASHTLHLVLTELSKLMAPFVPFFAEALYKSLGTERGASVHAQDWPKLSKLAVSKKLLSEMEEVRRVATSVLSKRAEAGIKVRQPLSKLTLKSELLKDRKELLDILQDEINVKRVSFDRKLKEELMLDTNITHELREEGMLRDFVRIIQDLRQDAKLEPKDKVVLIIQASEELSSVLRRNEELVKREVGATKVEHSRSEKFDVKLETKLDGESVWLGLRK